MLQFELVCGNDIYIEVSIMMVIIVQSVFAVPATKLADAIGRKPVLLISVMARGIIGCAIALSPNFTCYVVLSCLFEVAQAVSTYLFFNLYL